MSGRRGTEGTSGRRRTGGTSGRRTGGTSGRRPPGPAAAGIAVALALGAAALAGCGVPQDPSPRVLDAEALPAELVEPSTTTTSAVVPVPRQTAYVYFVDGERLARPVERELAQPGSLAALEALIAGPSADEAIDGLTSAMPAETVILNSDLTDGVLRVDLAEGALEQIEGELQRLAIAQLVYTATELAGIDYLWVQIEGEARALPTDEGDVEAPVGRVHYASLGPPGLGGAGVGPG